MQGGGARRWRGRRTIGRALRAGRSPLCGGSSGFAGSSAPAASGSTAARRPRPVADVAKGSPPSRVLPDPAVRPVLEPRRPSVVPPPPVQHDAGPAGPCAQPPVAHGVQCPARAPGPGSASRPARLTQAGPTGNLPGHTRIILVIVLKSPVELPLRGSVWMATRVLHGPISLRCAPSTQDCGAHAFPLPHGPLSAWDGRRRARGREPLTGRRGAAPRRVCVPQ